MDRRQSLLEMLEAEEDSLLVDPHIERIKRILGDEPIKALNSILGVNPNNREGHRREL